MHIIEIQLINYIIKKIGKLLDVIAALHNVNILYNNILIY